MASAVFHGKQGKVTFAATATSNVLNWTLEASCGIVDTTIMSSVAYAATTHWKDYTAGYKTWTAIIECDLEDSGFDPDLDADFAQDTDGIAVVLHEGMVALDQAEAVLVRMFTGNGIVTSVAPSLDRNDVAKVTYTVQGSGTLVEAASDAT